MNSRVKKLRNMLLEITHDKFRDNRFEETIINKDTQQLPLIIRKAMAFKKAAEEMPVYIQEGELVIGARTIFKLPVHHTDKEFRQSKSFVNNNMDGIFHNMGRINYCIDEVGAHVAESDPPNYSRLIEKGLQWHSDYALDKLKQVKLDPDQNDYYKSLGITVEGIQNHIKRYVRLIEKTMDRVGLSEKRKKELTLIKKDISNIINNPPDSFYQAVQLVYFIHTLLWIEAGMLIPIGRIDQFLYPLFKKDISKGRLTGGKALEIMECFFIKVNFEADRPGSYFQEQYDFLKGDDGQVITLGGTMQGSEGKSGVSELTYIIMDALKELKLIDPTVHIRVSMDSEDRLWEKIMELYCTGLGTLMIDCEENIKQAMEKVGIYSKQDMADFTGTGCWEIVVGGKSSYRQCGTIELLRPLEWLLFNGGNLVKVDGIRPVKDNELFGIDFGDLEKINTFEELLDKYKKELRYYISTSIDSIMRSELSHTPLLSILIDDCLKKGKDLKDGGALYRETDLQASSIANIADSLFAIKKLVFDNRVLSLSEYAEAIRSNYKDSEGLRQEILHKIEKYGNDIEEVDSIASEIAEFYADEVNSHTNNWGGPFRARIAGVSSYVDNLETIGASPDGRKIGDYTSHNSSPQLGMSKYGPTAEVKTVSKIDQSRFAGGFILDLKFSKSMFQSDDKRKKVIDLVKTYFKLGGLEVQINVVDTETLKDAKKNPEKYRDLIVRVWGFSAYFVDLPVEFQDHIIRREEFSSF